MLPAGADTFGFGASAVGAVSGSSRVATPTFRSAENSIPQASTASPATPRARAFNLDANMERLLWNGFSLEQVRHLGLRPRRFAAEHFVGSRCRHAAARRTR